MFIQDIYEFPGLDTFPGLYSSGNLRMSLMDIFSVYIMYSNKHIFQDELKKKYINISNDGVDFIFYIILIQSINFL